jgi:cell wall-associated NlpC family hydrolase
MNYGICSLSVIPLRAAPSDASEMVSQILYGEFFEVLEVQKKWSRVKLYFDGYEGWIDTKQHTAISEKKYQLLCNTPPSYLNELVDFISTPNAELIPILLGSTVSSATVLKHQYEGNLNSVEKASSNQIIETALLYLNAPYLWGGKTPFGIDCSGFTQMVYKISGYCLQRDASQQATQGETLSFLEESLPGDLAFFDNEEGIITHVGIILGNNQIIHASGQVRIDTLDHSGIFNKDIKTHTHKLRVLKRIR